AATCRSTASTRNSTSGTWRGSRAMTDIRWPMVDDRVRDRDRVRVRVLAAALLSLVAAFTYPSAAARQMPSAPGYAVRGAKIGTGAPTSDKGTLVMRNGILEEVGGTASVRGDAVVVDAANMTVYPGLIDMTNTAAVEPPRAAGAGSETATDTPAPGG